MLKKMPLRACPLSIWWGYSFVEINAHKINNRGRGITFKEEKWP
jgi:hypothetical protein